MKRIIFHIPNQINKNLASGSQIRPVKMLEAFKNVGYHVDVVMGRVKERKQQISNIKQNIKQGVKYSFLYSESSTMPTALTEPHHLPIAPFLDFKFFRFCKKNNIKIGLFYRDIYWVFEEYKKGTSFFKRILAKSFYKFDLYNYNKSIDILYLPSKLMNNYIPVEINCEIKELPPAISSSIIPKKEINNNEIDFIYIGGVSPIYDIKLFVKVVCEIGVNAINLCTRENEWKQYSSNYQSYSNCINVYHKSGDKLKEIYDKSTIGVYFVEPKKIWNFAIGVKLFEYIGYRKPIIAVEGTAVGSFVSKNNIGWVIPYDGKELKKLILFINKNPQEVLLKKKNIENIIDDNTWESRIEKIDNDLSLI